MRKGKKISIICMVLCIAVLGTLVFCSAESDSAAIPVTVPEPLPADVVTQMSASPSDFKHTGMTADDFLRTLGASEKEINAIPTETKAALLGSEMVTSVVANYGIAEDGTPFLVTKDVAESCAELMNSGMAVSPCVDSEETTRTATGFFSVTTYVANPETDVIPDMAGYETLNIVTVNWLTAPPNREKDTIGITLTNNSVWANSPSAIMTYTKTRHAAYLDPVVEDISVNYTSENAVSLSGSEAHSVCYEFDLPEDETLVNGWWYEYTDFVMVMTCRGFFYPRTPGTAAHWAVGYYSHASIELTVDTSYTVGLGYGPDGVEGIFQMYVDPEFEDEVTEVRAPVFFESVYG